MTNDKYFTKIVIMRTDGRISATEAYRMLDTCHNEEIFELMQLSMDLSIYENSLEHLKLVELSNKYITEKAIQCEVW